MPAPTRGRIILAWVVVVLTMIAVWKFVDYRNRPPEISKQVSGDI